MPLDKLFPPAQYDGGWILLAVGLIIVSIVVTYVVRAATRPLRASEFGVASNVVPSGDVLGALRAEYRAQIDEVERAFHAQEISAKDAHREFSTVVRNFVNEYSGLEAPVLTLADLRARDVHPALLDAIERHYYPSIFRRSGVIDPRLGARAAREVVDVWH